MDGKPLKAQPSKEEMTEFFEYLKKASPDLSKYGYKEWDDDMRSKVNSVISNKVPRLRTSDAVMNSTASSENISVERNSSAKSSPINEAPEENIDLDSLDLGTSENFDDDLYAGL
jgi:hypothetical protein